MNQCKRSEEQQLQHTRFLIPFDCGTLSLCQDCILFFQRLMQSHFARVMQTINFIASEWERTSRRRRMAASAKAQSVDRFQGARQWCCGRSMRWSHVRPFESSCLCQTGQECVYVYRGSLPLSLQYRRVLRAIGRGGGMVWVCQYIVNARIECSARCSVRRYRNNRRRHTLIKRTQQTRNPLSHAT